MRKRLQENKWRVSLQTAQGQPIEKVVDAPSMSIAINRAQSAFQGQQFVSATATQIDSELNVPTAQSSQQNMLPKQLQPLQPLSPLTQPGQQQQVRRESYVIDPKMFQYPYSITLPAQFKKVLHESAPGKVQESVGQYRIILENSDEMHRFLEKLKTNHNRACVRIIVSGIRNSI